MSSQPTTYFLPLQSRPMGWKNIQSSITHTYTACVRSHHLHHPNVDCSLPWLWRFINRTWFSLVSERAAVNLYSAAVADPSQTKRATCGCIWVFIFNRSRGERVNLPITGCFVKQNGLFWAIIWCMHIQADPQLQILNAGGRTHRPRVEVTSVMLMLCV